MAVVLPVKQHTPEWLEARENGIGASQAAAALGLDPWESPTGLWAQKLKLVPPAPENLAMRLGTELEPFIARLYTEATGVKVRRANNLRQHSRHPFMLASIDRRAGRKPIELKWSARATGYGEPGTDEVPDHVLVQVLHQLAVLDEPEGEVVLLKAGAPDIAIYPIKREAQAEAEIIERESVFWDAVLARREPPIDGSEATHRTLAALYPRGIEETALDADEETARAIRTLRVVRRELDASEAQRSALEARIKAAMLAAGATVIRLPGVGEIPWRTTKDRETTDWKAVAQQMAAENPDVFAALVANHTTTKASAPRFGPPRWEEE